MKFLEVPSLEQLDSELSCISTIDSKIVGKIEVYSCKSVTADKRLYKTVDHRLDEELSASPDPDHDSPFGPLTSKVSRKTFCNLIATLNAAFPDYDFSNVKVEDFVKHPSLQGVIQSINITLQNVGKENDLSHLKIWETIDHQIKLQECDIYSFLPDEKSDPFTDLNCIWSFNFFFFNKNVKQILFFALHSVSSLYEDFNSIDGDDTSVSSPVQDAFAADLQA